ncbi:EexN family lipoprotein [Sulfuricurvum sp. RIFCSPLOWO2_12_FULL_43_24]|uniref:EexN family lipoprotein n=1 Tax=Sulfuricurvum sp. RIFCSPLOWO2_12_FULL_43_24 TaxID=1802247 RepID=UPI0008BFACB9|nr:EexN family lipoprotein [Sulfuricurvum sp. RIFCSPLOWO2_12_FULL_43_24]OHD81632.1 MAG: hypothetical protein A3D90_01990 [Sulfuricurvum sp. RIFCSPHIGHO2_02_FULL_43_9]OHD89074.1 MAG: hypothetical protein A3G19_07755 [Sulfuricurvum sp. RIFCSPLOWO2_12_FULL_43_24]
MKTVLTIATITAILLTGCGSETKTQKYYEDHLDEAKSLVAECKTAQSMTEEETTNCGLAEQALFFHTGKKPIKGDEKDIKTW